VANQAYKGTHRHRPPLGWHPPRNDPESWQPDRDRRPGEPTEPFTPAFTGEFPVQLDGLKTSTVEPLVAEDAPSHPVTEPGDQNLKRWKFALVVAAVWILSAAIGVGLYYWWFHTIDKTPPVFVVLIFLVVATVGGLIAAMVQNKPLVSALSVALMSAPFAAVGGAAVLHGTYFCDHVARCLMGVIPY
jgi:hypothetical protein